VTHPFLNRLFLPLFENYGYVVMLPALATRFEPHRDRLQQDFTDYAESLTTQGVLDVLFGIGFLGVKRGHKVVYSDGVQVPLHPGEEEFHVHPCFRPALGGLGPVDLTPYSPGLNRNIYVANALVQAATGSDISFGISRDSQILDDVVRACERLLRQLMRAGLPADMRTEVQARIGHVLDGARRAREDLRNGVPVDATGHVLAASDFLGNLATQLGEHGIREEPITRRLEDEARALIRSAGGAVGGGGGSASAP